MHPHPSRASPARSKRTTESGAIRQQSHHRHAPDRYSNGTPNPDFPARRTTSDDARINFIWTREPSTPAFPAQSKVSKKASKSRAVWITDTDHLRGKKNNKKKILNFTDKTERNLKRLGYLQRRYAFGVSIQFFKGEGKGGTPHLISTQYGSVFALPRAGAGARPRAIKIHYSYQFSILHQTRGCCVARYGLRD